MKSTASRTTTLMSLLLTAAAVAQTGPMVGTVTTTDAHFLYRPGAVEKPLRLTVLNAGGAVVATSTAESDEANDYVAKFQVSGLQPATAYTYKVDDLSGSGPMQVAGPSDGLRFRTALPQGVRGVVTVGIASCANSSSEPVWERMGLLGVDRLLLGGDTPYVDVADLPTIRTKHRQFLETPFMRQLIRRTPTLATWDDHDFGLNNGNGVNAGDRRANTRRGFMEYRAHDQFGTGDEGIYHKVDLGVMEVFLLDPRWWSQTEASPVDGSKKTCFGPEQWEWIRQALEASRAPFKVLAMGEIWQDKKNGENDDQFTYWYERDALFDFIREKNIPGVVLVGGDIHVSRHLVHRQRVGYDLHDFVTSPAHTSVIPSLDVTHPDLEWSSQQPRQFLTLTADTRVNPALLTARFYLADGTMQREVKLPYDRLTPEQGGGIGRGLRAWWNFDGDLANRAVTGSRFDAVAVNGATLVSDGGLKGGAVSLSRGSEQYLRIGRETLDDSAALPERAGRNPLDDNTAAYTASLWCRATGLPEHGSADRQFLAESALGGTTAAGYVISVGFRSAETDAEKINLELYTVTLQPAGASSTAQPTPLAQGPFACELDRSLFDDQWAHVAVTFDSTHLRLHVNGQEVAVHELATPGPAAETAGLILGGHRAGTGRNFDGSIDEVALWTRALTAAEIASLWQDGAPPALPVETSAIDTDGDTLEDWWEILHGLDPENSQDALADMDGDAVPAWLERGAGTHPQIDDSALFDALREVVSPGEADVPMVFRHPSQDTLQLRLTLGESIDLSGWSLLSDGEATTAGADDGELQFQLSPSDEARRFFGLKAAP